MTDYAAITLPGGDVNLPSGNIEDYVYDNLNRLTTETIKRPDNTSHPIEETYDYTLLSNGQRDHVIETRYASNGSVFGTTKVGWPWLDESWRRGGRRSSL